MHGNAVITDAEARESVEWLLDNAAEIGAAKADAKRADLVRRAAFTIATTQADGKTVADREAEAYRSERYASAVRAEVEAIKTAEELRALQAGHQARIEAWRTFSASARAVDRGGHSA